MRTYRRGAELRRPSHKKQLLKSTAPSTDRILYDKRSDDRIIYVCLSRGRYIDRYRDYLFAPGII